MSNQAQKCHCCWPLRDEKQLAKLERLRRKRARKKKEQKKGPERRELGSCKETQRVCVARTGASLAGGRRCSQGGALGHSFRGSVQVAPFKVKRKPGKDLKQRSNWVLGRSFPLQHRELTGRGKNRGRGISWLMNAIGRCTMTGAKGMAVGTE